MHSIAFAAAAPVYSSTFATRSSAACSLRNGEISTLHGSPLRGRFAPRHTQRHSSTVTVVRATTTMSAAKAGTLAGKKALVIGGTRFSGLYLVHELHARGCDVTLFNRGSKAVDDPELKVPGESDAEFAARAAKTSLIVGDRTDPESLRAGLEACISYFDVVFDNNGREKDDSSPLIDMLVPHKTHYVCVRQISACQAK